MSRVMYIRDHEGNWYRREWAEQCQHKGLFLKQCQGIKGHKGVHWSYRPDGSLVWEDNDDPLHNWAAGSTPPGHERYVSPIDMQPDHHLSHYTETQVTDPELLAKLESDELDEDGASTVRPVESLPDIGFD